MRILITGGGGMLGRDLAPALAPKHDVRPYTHPALDVTQPAQVDRIFSEVRPDLVIHCAAFTDVDGCERDPARAFAVNAGGAENVARAAERVGARLFLISTDYVFDGEKPTPYDERDAPNPIGVYGLSKFEGERRTLARNGQSSPHLVIRTSWLYGLHGPNFVEKILAAAQSHPELEVVADQIGYPTWTAHLARKIAELVETPATGILHAGSTGQCSRYEFACAIVESLPQPARVIPIDSAQASRPARRPPYSVLGCRRLRELGLAPLPHWKEALEEYFQNRPALPVGRAEQRGTI